MLDLDERTVSVILPTYNRAHVLGRAVASALEQTYPHVELVVVDDCSTDETPRLEELASPRLTVLRMESNGGPSRARNLGIARSTGAYVAFLDSDDGWEPWKLEAPIDCFRRGPPELGAVYCGKRVFLADGATVEIRPTKRGFIFPDLLRRNFIIPSTLVVKRAVLDHVGVFDPLTPNGCEDWDLGLRIARCYAFD